MCRATTWPCGQLSINEGIGYSGGEVSGRETGLQVKVASARTKCPVNLILT